MTSRQYITSHRVRRNVPFLHCAQIFYTTLIIFTEQHGVYIIFLFIPPYSAQITVADKMAIYKTSINLFLYIVSLKKGGRGIYLGTCGIVNESALCLALIFAYS